MTRVTIPTVEASTIKPIKQVGFVLTQPFQTLDEIWSSKKIQFSNPNNDLVFSYEQTGKNTVGYELDEDTLLCKLKSEGYPVKIKKCSGPYVSDGIGDGYELWESQKPVLISAQTGSGKNTFIEEVLIPYRKKLNYTQNVKKKILILSNRIALNAQLKSRIENTGVAQVMLYQSFLNFAELQKNLDQYSHIVCDECHFFSADAMFNPTTALILDGIIRKFQHAVRIYMSSTFTDCLPYIFDYEKRIYRLNNQKLSTGKNQKFNLVYDFEFLYYKFNRDYSYLTIGYYSAHMDLKDTILDSVERGEKWLIFIDNTKQCQRLKADLLQYSNSRGDGGAVLTEADIMVIDARNKVDAEYIESIKSERFNCKILISTSVIDNGINIKDAALKNIVVSDISKSKCLQMVGRKRVVANQQVNLYIQKFDVKHMEKLLEDLERQREGYGLYNRAYCNFSDTKNTSWEILNAKRAFNAKFYNGEVSDFEDAKHWFYRDNDNPELVKPNDLAVSLLDEVLFPRCRYILARMKEAGDGREFLEHQLSWFGDTYNEEKDVTLQNRNRGKEEFLGYANGLASKVIPKADKKSFGIELFNKYRDTIGVRDKDNQSRIEEAKKDDGSYEYYYGKAVINDIFETLSIDLEIVADGSAWVIRSTK